MASNDLDKARSRFVNATNRIVKGIERQQKRILERKDNAPTLPAGEYVITDLRGDPTNDVDYYIYELARLQDVAREVIKVFDQPQEIVNALDGFDTAVPNLRKIRNPLTHTSDDARLDDVLWFESAVRALPDGGVEYLVDPRYQHHSAALELSDALLAYLRAGIKSPTS